VVILVLVVRHFIKEKREFEGPAETSAASSASAASDPGGAPPAGDDT
jgi:hypothetical protein